MKRPSDPHMQSGDQKRAKDYDEIVVQHLCDAHIELWQRAFEPSANLCERPLRRYLDVLNRDRLRREGGLCGSLGHLSLSMRAIH